VRRVLSCAGSCPPTLNERDNILSQLNLVPTSMIGITVKSELREGDRYFFVDYEKSVESD
jgi:hypothetical protein